MAVLLLMGQRRIAELDRPLLDVEAELRIVERQLLEAAEEPHERDPVVGREIAPERGMLVVIGEDAEARNRSPRGSRPCPRAASARSWSVHGLAFDQSTSLLSA